jgi:drug/metabolite transporter (DMT)-like permease
VENAVISNVQGAIYMVIAMVGVTGNDAAVKLVMQNLDMGMIILIRGIMATTILAVLAWHHRTLGSLRLTLHPLVAIRVVCEFLATITFLTALRNLPLANLSAIFQSLPIMVTVAGALLLGIAVSPRGWLVILIGFAGVLIIVRPGLEGFNQYSVYALASVLCCVGRDLVTRQLPANIPSWPVSLVTAFSVTVAGAMLVPFSPNTAIIQLSDLATLLAAATMMSIGYHMTVMAMRVTNISFVAPFRYTQLVFATTMGYLVFNELPDLPTILGGLLVILAGLYSFYREAQTENRSPALANLPPKQEIDPAG